MQSARLVGLQYFSTGLRRRSSWIFLCVIRLIFMTLDRLIQALPRGGVQSCQMPDVLFWFLCSLPGLLRRSNVCCEDHNTTFELL